MHLESLAQKPQKEVYVVDEILKGYIENPESISVEWVRKLGNNGIIDREKYYLCVQSLAKGARSKVNGICLNWSGKASLDTRIRDRAMKKAKELADDQEPQFTDDELDLFKGLESQIVNCRHCLKSICIHRPYNIPREDVLRRQKKFNPFAA